MSSALMAMLWSRWSVPDWFSVIGFPLAVAGLVFTGVGVWKTRGATMAVHAAVSRLRRRLSTDYLLLRIPELLHAERDLQRAVDDNDHTQCQRHLDEWQDAANDIVALVRSSSERQELHRRLKDAVPFVVAARDSLGDPTRPARDATIQVMERLRVAKVEANQILIERITLAEEPDDG